MKILITAFLIINLLLSSCIEQNGFTESVIVNTSSHDVRLLPYKNNAIDSEYIADISAHTQTRVLFTSAGLGNIEPCYNSTAASYDSVVFVYDVAVKIAHLPEQAPAYAHSIPASSPRSVMNGDNYYKTIRKKNNHRSEATCSFTITEQDYLDAL